MSAMQANTLMDALVQGKRIYHLLGEVMDLSNQLAEALDRNDQVTVRMLVNMRSEPIEKLKAAQRALREQRDDLSGEAKERLAALLKGEPAVYSEEEPLHNQLAANQRLLKRVIELDERLNRRLTGDKSVYNR